MAHGFCTSSQVGCFTGDGDAVVFEHLVLDDKFADRGLTDVFDLEGVTNLVASHVGLLQVVDRLGELQQRGLLLEGHLCLGLNRGDLLVAVLAGHASDVDRPVVGVHIGLQHLEGGLTDDASASREACACAAPRGVIITGDGGFALGVFQHAGDNVVGDDHVVDAGVTSILRGDRVVDGVAYLAFCVRVIRDLVDGQCRDAGAEVSGRRIGLDVLTARSRSTGGLAAGGCSVGHEAHFCFLRGDLVGLGDAGALVTWCQFATATVEGFAEHRVRNLDVL